ncbi:hypothetical protein B0H10DRAFT_2216707 [Mycena sp. CBHHK59/15]|nr:hypothetical protein B0H10DRAFT_2216707 [Mycena sp. CBHHK59/15]
MQYILFYLNTPCGGDILPPPSSTDRSDGDIPFVAKGANARHEGGGGALGCLLRANIGCFVPGDAHGGAEEAAVEGVEEREEVLPGLGAGEERAMMLLDIPHHHHHHPERKPLSVSEADDTVDQHPHHDHPERKTLVVADADDTNVQHPRPHHDHDHDHPESPALAPPRTTTTASSVKRSSCLMPPPPPPTPPPPPPPPPMSQLTRIRRLRPDAQYRALLALGPTAYAKEGPGDLYFCVRYRPALVADVYQGRASWAALSTTALQIKCGSSHDVGAHAATYRTASSQRLVHLKLKAHGAALVPEPCDGCHVNHREFYSLSGFQMLEDFKVLVKSAVEDAGGVYNLIEF